MSARTRLLVVLLSHLCAAALAEANEPPDSRTLWTVPAEPRAGEPLRVVAFPTVFADEYYSPANMRLSIEGSIITVVFDFQGCGPQTWCDVVISRPVQIDLPPLAAGEYTLRVFRSDDATSPAVERTLLVTDSGAGPEPLHPVEGWWWDPANPGYGLILQRRRDFVGLSGFGWWGGTPLAGSWVLMTGRLDGDRYVSTLQELISGSCIHAGCTEPYRAPSTFFAPVRAARIQFLSSREMEIEDQWGQRMRLVAMPVGGGYRSDFGMPEEVARLPLPDLRGTWVFTVDPAARETYWIESSYPLTIRFETLETEPENELPEVDLAWRGVDPSEGEGAREYSLLCVSSSPSRCSLRFDGLQGVPPPSPVRQWRATLDNIAQDRIEATWGEGDHLVRVRGFRVD